MICHQRTIHTVHVVHCVYTSNTQGFVVDITSRNFGGQLGGTD